MGLDGFTHDFMHLHNIMCNAAGRKLNEYADVCVRAHAAM